MRVDKYTSVIEYLEEASKEIDKTGDIHIQDIILRAIKQVKVLQHEERLGDKITEWLR